MVIMGQIHSLFELAIVHSEFVYFFFVELYMETEILWHGMLMLHLNYDFFKDFFHDIYER